MSAEHHPKSHEHNERHAHSEKAASELEAAGAKQIEHARHSAEAAAEHSENRAERDKEAARKVIHEQEVAPEPVVAEKEAAAPPQHHIPALLNQHLNYTQTLASVQRRLTPVSRSFSRVIHAPAVEKVSEAIENNIARPSVTAGATWTALIVGSIFYFTARRYGYNLAGSEITLSFVVGAIIGLVIEWFWRTFIHRPKH